MDAGAAPLQVGFDRRKPGREFFVGGAQGTLRLELELAGEVGDRKQQVAQFFGRPFRVLGQRFAQLAHFLVDLVHHPDGVGPVKADGRHTRADFVGTQQARQGSGHARQQALFRARAVLLGRLDLLPLGQHGGRRRGQSPTPLSTACKRPA